LLVAVSLLGASLGVTPVQSAFESTPADGDPARESNTKVAATQEDTPKVPSVTPHVQSNQLKWKNPPVQTNNKLVPAVQSNQGKLMLNPQPLPPEK
jgi:hypothetical protein